MSPISIMPNPCNVAAVHPLMPWLSNPFPNRYRFAEIRYHRPEETHKGRLVPARVETVVIFLPDVWSCTPTRLEWETLQATYRKQLQEKIGVENRDGDQQAPDTCYFYHSHLHRRIYPSPHPQYILLHIYTHFFFASLKVGTIPRWENWPCTP